MNNKQPFTSKARVCGTPPSTSPRQRTIRQRTKWSSIVPMTGARVSDRRERYCLQRGPETGRSPQAGLMLRVYLCAQRQTFLYDHVELSNRLRNIVHVNAASLVSSSILSLFTTSDDQGSTIAAYPAASRVGVGSGLMAGVHPRLREDAGRRGGSGTVYPSFHV